MLFKEACDRLLEHMRTIDRSPKTIDLYKRDLKVIQLYLESRHNGPVYIEDVTVADIEAFMGLLKDVKNYSPYSRSRFFYTIRSLYAFAYKKEIVDRNIALSLDFIKMPKKEKDYLAEDEVEKITQQIKNRLIKLVTIFLFNTGLRISECLNLTLEDVDLDRKLILVREGKGKKDRFVPINDVLYELLLDYRENWRDALDSDKFFATRKTGSLSYGHVNSTLNEAAKKLGIKKKVSCHALRHSFASTLVKRNVGLVQIQKLLGHSSLAVTSIYTHTNLDQLSEAVNALNG